MQFINNSPSWYLFLAFGISFYYAYRGFRGCWIGFARTNESEKKESRRQFTKSEIVSIYWVHDMLFHFICSLAGFFALLVAKYLFDSLLASQTFDTGKSILLVFSFLFGIIGVTDQLPVLIPQGKIPSFK